MVEEKTRKKSVPPVKDTLPTSVKVGDRTYDVVSFLREEEDNKTSVYGYEMVDRAMEASAHLGEDDGQYLLDYQDDTLTVFREEAIFVFTDWRLFDDPDRVCCIFWYKSCWVGGYRSLDENYHNLYKLLRRRNG